MIDSVKGVLTQPLLFHRNEPLLGGAKDHRLLAAPAVRIAVREFLFLQQGSAVCKFLDDLGISVKYQFTLQIPRLGGEFSVGIHGSQNFEAVTHADLVVFLAVPGGDMNAACALILSHELAENDFRVPIHPWMAANDALQFRARLVAAPKPEYELDDYERIFGGRTERSEVYEFVIPTSGQVRRLEQRVAELEAQIAERQRPGR